MVQQTDKKVKSELDELRGRYHIPHHVQRRITFQYGLMCTNTRKRQSLFLLSRQYQGCEEQAIDKIYCLNHCPRSRTKVGHHRLGKSEDTSLSRNNSLQGKNSSMRNVMVVCITAVTASNLQRHLHVPTPGNHNALVSALVEF